MGGKFCVTPRAVSDRKAIDASFCQVVKDVGRVDVLINNAGIIQPPLDVTELDPELWDRVVDVNLKGVYNCTRAAGKIMLRQKSGVIINITSTAGIISSPLVAYGPAKAAVDHFTRIVARGWADKGIRVNAIAPGVVLTPMAENAIKAGWRNRDTMLKFRCMSLSCQRILLRRPYFCAHGKLVLSLASPSLLTLGISPMEIGQLLRNNCG